jgi:AcrR family transcriptional regulator
MTKSNVSTRDRILDASLEIIVASGYEKMTTTQVANFAGISIATLYKYFPNKRSLTYSLIEHMLQACAVRMEEACRQQHGKPLPKMVQALVSTYWLVNFERPDLSKVIDRPIDDINKVLLLGAFNRRVEAATSIMLATAPGVAFDNLSITSLTLLAGLFGAVRGITERDLPPTLLLDVHNELARMCLAYLNAAAAS